ncbi:hypothetical protein [Aminobacter sp. AP02]|uniref:hypothetical protein n=1 Tax=Aminobacter sp. AP02 TaxID=2135737 RepID=UPI000D6C66C1|nr:hypothetical protein [Aminobacter sp. AP02]PWK68220.1 hypothetical protein C8K44_111132 [Aminobacter sp. AP02]
MKILSSLRGLLSTPSCTTESERERFLGWMRDPLSHPDIERMDARELGDLPLNPGFRRAAPVLGERACRA